MLAFSGGEGSQESFANIVSIFHHGLCLYVSGDPGCCFGFVLCLVYVHVL